MYKITHMYIYIGSYMCSFPRLGLCWFAVPHPWLVSFPRSFYIYMYMYVCVCVYVYMCMYVRYALHGLTSETAGVGLGLAVGCVCEGEREPARRASA